MTFRTLVALFAFCSICVPQLLVEIPELSERVKTPDLFAVIAVPLALLLYASRCSPGKLQFTTFLTFAFAAVVIFVRILLDSNRELYLENLPHLARLFSILAPLFLVVAMPSDRKTLYRFTIGFGVLATGASIAIALLYHFGSTAFDAHQTFARQGGDLTHRLGGLPGESGAFAFNATVGIQLLLVGLAMAKLRKQYYLALWILFPLFIALVYHESLARISLLNSLVFFSVSLVGVNHSRFSSRFLLLMIVLVGSTTFLLLSAAGNPLADVEVERVNFSGSLDGLSSGRLSHWKVASEVWLDSPGYVLFGMGHRAPDFILDHPVENMVLFHLVNYGIIGTVLFGCLYASLAWPILRAGIRGDFGGGAFSAMLLSILVQWQVNDVNLYYQTFPCLLFFSAWYRSVLENEKKDIEEKRVVAHPVAEPPEQRQLSTSA